MWAQVADVTPWLALVIQGGALALLAIVVVWIQPRQHKEDQEERERREQRMQTMSTLFASTINEVVNTLQTRFQERNDKIIQQMDKNIDRMERALKESGNQIESAVLRIAGYNDPPSKRKPS